MVKSSFIQYIRAGDPLTTPENLYKLMEFGNTSVRRRVAENPNCPSNLLSVLANDQATGVRRAVGHNEQTPQNILEQLICDENPDVRYSMASNPKLPLHCLNKLAQDDNPYVSNRAKKTLKRLYVANQNLPLWRKLICAFTSHRS